MQKKVESQLSQAIMEFEFLINSEHRELFMDILCDYVKNRSFDRKKVIKAQNALKTIQEQFV